MAASDRDHSHHGKGHKLQALVYHETTGFRHSSIPYAIEQLTLWGAANGFEVTADQTSAQFTDRGLRKYDVVVWLSTVGGVRGDAPLLTGAEGAAFQRYIRRGGGYAGIHASLGLLRRVAVVRRAARQPSALRQPSGRRRRLPGFIGSRPREPNRVGQTGSCFQAAVVTEDGNYLSTRHLPARWNISESSTTSRRTHAAPSTSCRRSTRAPTTSNRTPSSGAGAT